MTLFAKNFGEKMGEIDKGRMREREIEKASGKSRKNNGVVNETK